MHPWNRLISRSNNVSRHILARLIAAAAISGLACIAPSTAQQLQKLRVSTIPIIDTAPLAAAIGQGYFKDEGLDVDTTPTVGGAVGLPAVAAGQVQIGYSNLVSIVLGAQQGLGFQIIAAGSASGDAPPNTAGLFAKKDSGLKTGADLDGKRIGVNTRNSINWLVAREWVRLNGGNPDRLTFLEVPFPSMADALRGNQIDVGYTVEPFLGAAVASGMEIIGWPYDRIMKRVPISQFVATKSYSQANPQIIEKWVRAYNRGIDWMNQNQRTEEGVALIAAHTRLKAEQVRTIAMPLWEKTVSADSIAKIVDVMRAHGMLEEGSKVDINDLLYKTATTAPK
jgi:NitT/TauT family transport system substrate-binding protein